MPNIVIIVTFNVLTLLKQQRKLTAPEAEHNSGIMSVQETRNYHNEIKLKHHDIGNG